MRREARMYLSDIQAAAVKIREYTSGKQFSDYEAGEMLRDATVWDIVVNKLPLLARQVDDLLSEA